MILLLFALICFPRHCLARYYHDSCFYYAFTGIPDTSSLHLVSQSPSCQVQTGQRTEHNQFVGILAQLTVANPGKTKHELDSRKDMLNPGPDFLSGAVAYFGRFIQQLIAAAILVSEVLRTAIRSADDLVFADIDLVTLQRTIRGLRYIQSVKTINR